jgi:putative transposase
MFSTEETDDAQGHVHRRADHRDFEGARRRDAASELCREHGISDATFYKFRSRFGGRTSPKRRKLKALEENRKLKKLLAEIMLDASTLKKMLERTSDSQLAETCCDLGDQ